MNTTSLTPNPVLPAVLRLPARLAPRKLQNHLFVTVLNRLFKQEILDDELEFLENKNVSLKIKDANLCFTFTLQNQKIVSCHARAIADLTIEGTVYDFLLMISRREDPDTLFFNRRLRLNGNTELGLYVKNFLDAVDLGERWKYLYKVSDKVSRIAERLG